MTDHNPRDVLDEATKALRDTPVPDGPSAEVLAATIGAIDHHQLADPVPADPLRRKRIMRYVGYTTATAAAVVIATLAGVLGLGGGSAAARVQKAMDEVAKAKSVRVVQKIGGETVSTIHHQGDTVRFEEPGKRVMVLDLKTRKRIELDPVAKTARRYDVTEEEARDEADEFAAAKDFLSFFRGIKDSAVKELKGDKIGDRPAKVYEISHPGDGKHAPMKGTLWVDEKIGLPIRLRHHDHPLGELTVEFEAWNEEFDAKLFKLDVPAGYTVIEGPGAAPTGRAVFVTFIQPAVEKVQKAESVVYTMTETRKDRPADTRTTTQYAQGGAARIEYPTGTIIAANGRRLIFDPQAKIYRTETYSPEQPRNLPQDFLDAILGAKDDSAKALGEEKVGGVTAKKYEVAVGKSGEEGSGTCTLWLDPATGYPVKVYFVYSKSGFTITFDKFRWNDKLDPKLFSLDPPEGYTSAGKQEIPIPSAKE